MIFLGSLLAFAAAFTLIIGVLAWTRRLPGNKYIGIKVPEVRKSKEVWDTAHQFAGPLWVAAGVSFGIASDAVLEARKLLAHIKPDVVLGFGGYVSVPGALAAASKRIPLFIHEQNAVAGMANQWLSHLARRVFTAFPKVLKGAEWVGNPLRGEFLRQNAPSRRFADREGPLQLLVVGGSLGAQALNEIVPKALALLPEAQRPHVLHQSGLKQIESLQANYQHAGVSADLIPFIKDTAKAYADADLVICRAGASTVTEIAAVGAAACFVPYPHAVDDHQSVNARYLVDEDAAWLMEQSLMTPEGLADFMRALTRHELLERARRARKLAKTEAVPLIVRACEELVE